ncbi:MAG: PIG-L family deacetylase [Bacteroidetes bacterium]|nr:PIG-L family deacetylase [Bacteroidota bacterium]
MLPRFISSLFNVHLFFFAAQIGYTQSLSSSQQYHQLLQLRETKRVLYVAAHPDDENTRLIAHLVNGEHAEVAYLSLTRGDGGQNLIGKELGVELGQIRTQELIKARSIDGGQQFFTRALDFGYSKDPSETLQNWDKDKVLADVVWAIRSFQPDLIITRFNTTPGITHGHHTTSAILANEAFALSSDPKAFPEQLNYVKPWQAKRIFFNAYNFRGVFEPEAGKRYYSIEVGGYNSLLGKSYHQLAADSRTMHKSQGFGASAGAGSAKDYLEQVGGEPYIDSPFDGIDSQWEAVPGGLEVKSEIDQLLESFNLRETTKNLPNLLAIRAAMLRLDPGTPWVKEKLKKLESLIYYSLGLKIEYVAIKEFGYPGEKIKTELLLVNPSQESISEVSFQLYDTNYLGKDIKGDEDTRLPIALEIDSNESYSQPHWLQEPLDGALFKIPNQQKIGLPFELKFAGNLSFSLGGQKFQLVVPLVYKYNDPIDGEVKQPFTLIPEVALLLSKELVFLVDGADPSLEVLVNFQDQLLEGNLDFEGLSSNQFKLIQVEDLPAQKQRKYTVTFLPQKNGKQVITARFTTSEGKVFDQITKRISYKHIPNLTYFSPAQIQLIQEDWNLTGGKVGYVAGAGDDVPEVLSALGYQVTFLEEDKMELEDLKQFQALVVGIRAYNTQEALASKQQVILDYVKAGGNLILQYNTSTPLVTPNLGPYPFVIGRDRVTVEGSSVDADWESSLLRSPNKIQPKDFEGWVQERGLYFASKIDARYQSPLTLQDPGEPATKGALITAKVGAGTFVYTGLSFFRQLPAGVPGAIKLFINLIEQ